MTQALRIRNYSWKAYLLAQHSFEDLAELTRQVKEEHANPRAAQTGGNETRVWASIRHPFKHPLGDFL